MWGKTQDDLSQIMMLGFEYKKKWFESMIKWIIC